MNKLIIIVLLLLSSTLFAQQKEIEIEIEPILLFDNEKYEDILGSEIYIDGVKTGTIKREVSEVYIENPVNIKTYNYTPIENNTDNSFNFKAFDRKTTTTHKSHKYTPSKINPREKEINNFKKEATKDGTYSFEEFHKMIDLITK